MSARDAAAARRNGGSQAVATRPQGDAAGTMRNLLEQMKPELALALPKHMTPERMARQALTAFRRTEKLDQCTPASFLGALMTCAQVGLEPGPQGHVYIIPFKRNFKVGGEWRSEYEATFILGYQGMLELARRSGELADVRAHTVYANEVEQGRFKVEYGTHGRIEHEPIIFGERGAPLGYYATATLKSGATPFVVLSRADVEQFRLRSATQKENPSGPWSTDYEPMAWKTCIRRLSRWLPQSAELAAAVAHEDTVRQVMPGEVVSSVLEEQPPAPELEQGAGEQGSDLGADPVTGEVTTEEPPDDPWATAQDPTTEPGWGGGR